MLELGAWLGTLINGYLADAVGRRVTVMIACVVFTVGVIVQGKSTSSMILRTASLTRFSSLHREQGLRDRWSLRHRYRSWRFQYAGMFE